MAVAAARQADPARENDRPWWSDADQAELDVLVWELVDGYFEHRERCAEERCPNVRQAIQVVLDWRRARDLRSYARWVRIQRELLELRQDVILHRSRR